MAHLLPLRSAPTIVYFIPTASGRIFLLPQTPLREKSYEVEQRYFYYTLQAFSTKKHKKSLQRRVFKSDTDAFFQNANQPPNISNQTDTQKWRTSYP